MTSPSRTIDRVRILSRGEVVAVLTDLRVKGKRAINTRQNLIIFRLATCCGLRVSEIVGLKLSNVRLGGDRPHIEIPASIAKRRKARKVPLWWDASTLADFTAWKTERERQGAKSTDRFVCSQAHGVHHKTGESSLGKPLSKRNAQAWFQGAVKVLGKERVSQLSIHCGRHSFCSHALAGGRTLPEVRDAAGHANISTTSIYLHVIGDDDGKVGTLFEFNATPKA